MSETPNRQPAIQQTESKTRKPYHTPHMEDYGKVNELTRSGSGPYNDFASGYTSQQG